MADNFEAINLSWVKNATDPLEVLKQGSDFLEDPLKISIDNQERVGATSMLLPPYKVS